MQREMPSIDYVRSLFDYDENNGTLLWKIQNGAHKTLGKIAGKSTKDGYRRIRINKKTYQASWVVWAYKTGQWPTNEIDHKNGVRSDDRFCNLREATRVQNCINRVRSVKENSYGFRGIKAHRNGKRFAACITVNKKQIHLGYYDSPALAAKAYDVEAIKSHGEFARLNFPAVKNRDWLWVSSLGFRVAP